MRNQTISTRTRRISTVSAPALVAVLLVAPQTAQAQLEQSPIDIRPEYTYYTPLPALNFNYATETSLSVLNTGSPDEHATIKATPLAGAGTLELSGNTYDLLQFHFHTESEHLKNGVASPMEVHMVHQRKGSSNLLVVGRWIQEQLNDNAAFTSLFSSFPQTSGGTATVANFNLTSLLPSTLGSYRYPGSLTTPDFGEGVQWVMLDSPLFLSAAQINQFKTLFPEGDTRHTQDLNGRIVLTDVQSFTANVAPEPSAFVLMGLGVVGLTVRARRRRN